MNNELKFIYWGTPTVASETLQILIDSGYVPQIVITNPDRPQGRGLMLTPSPTKVLAEKYNIKVLTPEKVDAAFISEIKSVDFDLSIVVAYGNILPEEIINLPKFGTLNIHYSLLPKYRGAIPLEAALLNGDKETGVTIQKMVRKLDAGDIVAQEKVNIGDEIKKEDLRAILIKEGAQLLCRILPEYTEGKITPVSQDESLVSHYGKINKEDGEINLNDEPLTLWHKYRAYEGWPGIYFFKNGKRIKITLAKYENNSFIIERVIPEGKKEIDYKNLI